MKSSDYFSKVYGPKHKNKTLSPALEKKVRAIEKAAARMELENFLNWLFDSTERAFDSIPDCVIKSFMPDEVSFRFFHTDSRDYVQIQLIKYLEGQNQFYTRNKETQNYKRNFPRKFSSVPKYFRENWDNPDTIMRNGYFETSFCGNNTLKSYVSKADISQNEYIGKFKAVFGETVSYCSEFEKFVRKI